MEIALEAWRSLHPVIERYPDAASEWDKLHFSELWEIVIKDRDLSNVIYNGVLHLRGNIDQRRDSAGLLAIFPEMKIVSPRDSKDYQEWELLNELENGLHEVFRQDQPQQTAAPAEEQAKDPAPLTDQEQRKTMAFEILQKKYDSSDKEERALYFHSGSGRHGKQDEFFASSLAKQDEFFASSLAQFIKDSGGGKGIERFIKDYVRPFKNKLKAV